MFGKNDLRFIESLYKVNNFFIICLWCVYAIIQVLRDVFHYVPMLTREQFLATGFAERKMIMATDVLRLCESKHKELTQLRHKNEWVMVFIDIAGRLIVRE